MPNAGEFTAPPRRFPVLYQINARTHLHALGAGGQAATFDDIPDAELDAYAARGLDWLYVLGVWQTGPAGREVSRSTPAIRQGCEDTLPDLTDDDICGSCFAVTGYEVHAELGGDAALARLRARLADRGIRLMLDFVPNHTALDHPWVGEHPDYYIAGTDDDVAGAPQNWVRLDTTDGMQRVFAYGRDPYFAGWPDTLQLDYSSPAVQAAMRTQLFAAASRCDGLRCDMAMLLLPDVFERTWGRSSEPFWPRALAAVRAERPGFTFMAEVYWDREYDLQQDGFDFTYDKRLYDRLVGDLAGVRPHLQADADFQAHSARFLENHDEPRAASVFGVDERHRAAAVLTFLCPGLRFFHEGEVDGARTHVSMHLCRAPHEAGDRSLREFYSSLLTVLREPVVHEGTWQLLDARPAWDGNDSHRALVVSTWSARDADDVAPTRRIVVVTNLADHSSQGYVTIPLAHDEVARDAVQLVDRVGPARYERHAAGLAGPGLYLDVGPWGHHVFDVA